MTDLELAKYLWSVRSDSTFPSSPLAQHTQLVLAREVRRLLEIACDQDRAITTLDQLLKSSSTTRYVPKSP